MLCSFRLKIGLLSMCLSGLLLLGFGFLATAALNRVGRARIDHELRALADAQVRKTQPGGHWRRFDDSLRSIYGEDASKQFVVKATRASGELLHATAGWPQELPPHALPLSLDAAPASLLEGPPMEGDLRFPPPEERDSPRERPFREPPPRRLPVRGPVYATLGMQSGEWRAMTIANEEVTLSIAMNLSGLRTETRRFGKSLLVAVPLGLMLIVAGGWLIGHMAHSGQLPLSLARINLADLACAAAEDARLLAPDRKTTLDSPPELFLVADADLLNQAFQNLVSNAVKFGDKAGVIEMALAERGDQAVFTISNTGRPIPKRDHDKVFDRFYRADKSRSREIEGSGLGLSIAREIARAHGGDLVLERSDEHGTSFRVVLPLRRTL